MSDSTDGFFALIFISFGVGLVAGCAITGFVVTGLRDKSAIEHHAAHYDAQTGDFTWNTP